MANFSGGGSGGAGTGVFNVVATVAPTLSTATSFSLQTIYTTPAAGIYRISAWVQLTVAGTAGTWQPQFNTVSDGHTTTLNVGGTATVSSQWSFTNGNVTFYADAGVNLQYLLTASGITGSPTTRYAWTLERLQ